MIQQLEQVRVFLEKFLRVDFLRITRRRGHFLPRRLHEFRQVWLLVGHGLRKSRAGQGIKLAQTGNVTTRISDFTRLPRWDDFDNFLMP
jgi:hypothetical protein